MSTPNFWWLFAAYSVVWLGVFGYVASLWRRQGRIERELEVLRRKQG